MENQLNNIRACWNMALQWKEWLNEYLDQCESQGALPDPIKREELRSEVENYYHRYRSLADHYVREHGGSVSCGEWNTRDFHWLTAA